MSSRLRKIAALATHLAVLIIGLACEAQNPLQVTYNFADFTLYPASVQQLIIQPLQPIGGYGGTILSGQPLHYVTGTNGSVTTTNQVSGYAYSFCLAGPYTNIWGTNFFPPFLTGAVNAQNWFGTPSGLVFYPTNAVLQVTNTDGSAYTTTTNGVVYVGVAVSNQFSGAALTNWVGLLSTNSTNFTLQTSNALYTQFIPGGGFSGFALTNWIGILSTNGSNWATSIGQVITNWVGVLSTNSTNWTISQAQAASNYAGVLSTNDTNWAASLLIAKSNIVVSNVTASGTISGNGAGLTNVPESWANWGNTITIIAGPGAGATAHPQEAIGTWDGTNFWIFTAQWTNMSGATGGSIGLWQGPNLRSLTFTGEVISPTAGTWCSNYVSGPRMLIYNNVMYIYAFGSTN